VLRTGGAVAELDTIQDRSSANLHHVDLGETATGGSRSVTLGGGWADCSGAPRQWPPAGDPGDPGDPGGPGGRLVAGLVMPVAAGRLAAGLVIPVTATRKPRKVHDHVR